MWYNDYWYKDALIDPEYNDFMDCMQKVGKYSATILDYDEDRSEVCMNKIIEKRPIIKARQVMKRGLV